MKITKEKALALDMMVHANLIKALEASELSGDPIILACLPSTESSLFDDDKYVNCQSCDIKIRYRPYVPDSVTKVCLTCAIKLQKAETAH